MGSRRGGWREGGWAKHTELIDKKWRELLHRGGEQLKSKRKEEAMKELEWKAGREIEREMQRNKPQLSRSHQREVQPQGITTSY